MELKKHFKKKTSSRFCDKRDGASKDYGRFEEYRRSEFKIMLL